MINPELRLSTPLSEVWPAWLLLGLLLCLVISEILQPTTIRTSFRMVFTRLERMYGDNAVSWFSRLCMDIFRMGTVAFVLYVTLYAHAPFSLLVYAEIIGIILLMLLIKQIVIGLTSYTFNLRRPYMLYRSQYSGLLTIICTALYPIALLDLHWGYLPVMKWLPVPFLAIMLILLTIKLIQDFYSDAKSMVYIAMYLLTVEIIPVAGALWWVSRIV